MRGAIAGGSNLWANRIFSTSQLFGNERTQFAMVGLSQDKKELTMVYGSERPNRRSHYAISTITLDKPLQVVQGQATQSVTRKVHTIPLSFDGEGAVDPQALKDSVSKLGERLKASSAQNVAVIAYGCDNGTITERFERSQTILDAAMASLAGLKPAKQLNGVNAGPLFPDACKQGKALEVIELF